MGACREITISYHYTFPGRTVNFTGESLYAQYTTLWYTWNKNIPNPSLSTTTLTKKVLGKTQHLAKFSLPPLLPAEHMLCSVQV